MGFRNKDVIIDKGLNCGIQHIKEHCKDVQPIVTCSSYTFLDIIERILKNTLNKCLGLFREGICKICIMGYTECMLAAVKMTASHFSGEWPILLDFYSALSKL